MVQGFEDALSKTVDFEAVYPASWMDDIDDIFNDDGERLEKAKRRKLTKEESEAKEKEFLKKKAEQESSGSAATAVLRFSSPTIGLVAPVSDTISDDVCENMAASHSASLTGI